jgi:hypothetical protein
MKMMAFWDVAPCSLIAVDLHFLVEAVRTSEMSVYFSETTWCYIPESCHQFSIDR